MNLLETLRVKLTPQTGLAPTQTKGRSAGQTITREEMELLFGRELQRGPARPAA